MTEALNTQLKDTLPVECRCVPSSPFYVRWLNRFGGIDYWMFERRQQLNRKQDSYEDFEPFITDYSQVYGIKRPFTKDVNETVIAGAVRLSDNEWYEISRIAYSPMVQWFDERSSSWIDIMVDKGDNSSFSDTPLHEIEFTFMLPKPQLQF